MPEKLARGQRNYGKTCTFLAFSQDNRKAVNYMEITNNSVFMQKGHQIRLAFLKKYFHRFTISNLNFQIQKLCPNPCPMLDWFCPKLARKVCQMLGSARCSKIGCSARLEARKKAARPTSNVDIEKYYPSVCYIAVSHSFPYLFMYSKNIEGHYCYWTKKVNPMCYSCESFSC